MTDRLDELSRILEEMVAENHEITARAVVRHSAGVFRHASDVTRHPLRKKLLTDFASRQTVIRQAIETSARKSKQALEQALARKQRQIDELTAQRDQLVASHRAAILAVTEIGGYPTWLRFFEGYDDIVRNLRMIGALPSDQNAERDSPNE